MAFQHIFTSAQIGLHPGSSGYCTVAQTEGIPGDLVKDLERLSTYDFSARNDPEMGGHSPVIYRYQVVQSHSGHYFVVSRISDAGADHTGRTNYLAQHLALDSSEILQLRDFPHLNPAALLLVGKPWKEAWDEMPQTLPNLTIRDLFPDENRVYDMPGKGCSTWRDSPLCTRVDQAPMLLESPWNTKCFLHLPPGQEIELLKLLNETLWLSGEEAWRYSFTTFLQREESHENYAWCAVSGGNAQEQASGAGQMLYVMDSLPQASDEALKYKAENGQEEPIEPEPVPEVTQPQVPPAGPTLHTPPPDPTPKPRLQTQPPQVTSPPSIEDFKTEMEKIGKDSGKPGKTEEVDNKRSACSKAFRDRHENYAKYIKSQIQGSSDLKFIESERDKLNTLMAEVIGVAKGLSAGVIRQTLLNIRTEIYDSLDKEITAILKEGIKPPEVAPPPPPLPEKGTPKKPNLAKIIAIFIVMIALVFAIIYLDEIKTLWNKTFSKKEITEAIGDPVNPDNEYKTSEELKAKVDKYFGTENAIVRLFVATNGRLSLTGEKAPLLFKLLSHSDTKDYKKANGIEVYQSEPSKGFDDLIWKDPEPHITEFGRELLYTADSNERPNIVISKVDRLKNSENLNLNKSFIIQVHHNSAIRVKMTGETEIIYILHKSGVFFNGLFDDGVRREKTRKGYPKIVIDPLLKNRLDQITALETEEVRLEDENGKAANFLVKVDGNTGSYGIIDKRDAEKSLIDDPLYEAGRFIRAGKKLKIYRGPNISVGKGGKVMVQLPKTQPRFLETIYISKAQVGKNSQEAPGKANKIEVSIEEELKNKNGIPINMPIVVTMSDNSSNIITLEYKVAHNSTLRRMKKKQLDELWESIQKKIQKCPGFYYNMIGKSGHKFIIYFNLK